MKQIGITETGEVAFNLDVFDNLKDANIIITKRLTDELNEKLVKNKDKCILHLSVTGMGSSILEKFVPSLEQTNQKFSELLDMGFPIEQVVLRIDPIIPTPKGIQTALKVLRVFRDYHIPRVRWSSMDMYKHVIERFEENGIKIPYKTFHASKTHIKDLHRLLNAIAYVDDFKLEACGEPGFEPTPCISIEDLKILGLENDIELIGNKEQRKHCSCPSNKTELIKGKPSPCKNRCVYCFWQN